MKKHPAPQKKNQVLRDKGNVPQTGDLFPETLPAFAPKWPENGTQPAKVLARLLSGERFTQPSYGFQDGWRLAAEIDRLQNLGWPIQVMDVQYTKGNGGSAWIAEYWLPADCIAQTNVLRAKIAQEVHAK